MHIVFALVLISYKFKVKKKKNKKSNNKQTQKCQSSALGKFFLRG